MLNGPNRELARFDLDTLFGRLSDHQTAGLAVSGGPDSVALMVLVQHWAGSCPDAPRIVVYTVDHGLRPQSASEARAVIALARRFGFTARALLWPGPHPETGLQAAARTARYRLIAGAMGEDGATLLVTAHHAQDQAETVLMRLAHGSGPKGLGGMAQKSEIAGIAVYRPLLAHSSDLLARVVKSAGIEAIKDPSNTDERFERVRWRRAMPGLSALGLDEKRLCAFATRMTDTEEVLRVHAAEAMKRVLSIDDFGVVTLDRGALGALPRGTGVRVLRAALATVSGRPYDRVIAPYEGVRDDLCAARPFATRTLHGCVIGVASDKVRVYREAARVTDGAIEVSDDEKRVWDNRFAIVAEAGLTLKVRCAGTLTRAQAEALAGGGIKAPMAAVRAVPLIRSQSGQLLAMGARQLARGCRVGLIAPDWMRRIRTRA